jgi:hypothetical protein
MAIDERSRHEMYLKLEEVLGPEAAATMMEHLPPVGWADVATKRDLEHLAMRLEGKLDSFEGKLDLVESRLGERLERELRVQTTRFVTFTATIVTIFTSIALLIAKFA